MNRVAMCENQGCRFILDLRLDGTTMDGVQKIVTKCPECGSGWTSVCPYCSDSLSVKLVKGRLLTACCGRGLHEVVKAA